MLRARYGSFTWNTITAISTHFRDIEMQAKALPLEEKAALVHLLIEELDMMYGADAEELWVDEAQRRADAYKAGELAAAPGDDVMTRVRAKLVKREL